MTYEKHGTYTLDGEQYTKVDFEMVSTEENPTEAQLHSIGVNKLWNGSTIFELDTFKIFFYSMMNGKWEDGDGHGRGEENE